MSYKWFESVSMNFSAYFVLLGLAALKIWETRGGGATGQRKGMPSEEELCLQ